VQAEDIVARITNEFEGVVPKSSWGETSLFYNPGMGHYLMAYISAP